MDSATLRIGERVRHYRRKSGRSLAAIAGLCGITDRYLSMIENGQRTPSPALLSSLASELGVPIAALLADGPASADTAFPESGEAAVARALMGYRATPRPEPVAPVQLRERVEAAWRVWQNDPHRFTRAAEILPPLIGDVEQAVRAHRAGSDVAARREVLRTAADLYGLLRSYCRRTGRLDLSLVVADRAMRAAEDADDPIRVAAAQWNLGHVLLSHDGPAAVEQAAEVALLGGEQLAEACPYDAEAAAVRGALELVAVVSDARRGRRWEARERLEQRATPLAQRAGDGNVMWTVFGPTNVELHALSIEMLAGEAAEGLRLADRIDTSRLPSRERQFTFGLEMARCHDLRREDAAVLVHLLSLEELAPEDLARSPLARDMIASLRQRVRPTYQRQVAALAERMQQT